MFTCLIERHILAISTSCQCSLQNVLNGIVKVIVLAVLPLNGQRGEDIDLRLSAAADEREGFIASCDFHRVRLCCLSLEEVFVGPSANSSVLRLRTDAESIERRLVQLLYFDRVSSAGVDVLEVLRRALDLHFDLKSLEVYEVGALARCGRTVASPLQP